MADDGQTATYDLFKFKGFKNATQQQLQNFAVEYEHYLWAGTGHGPYALIIFLLVIMHIYN